jgi:hypothetical protein
MYDKKTFKVTMGSDEDNWLITINHYTNEEYLTENGSLINFRTEEEAKSFVKKLNDIVNSTNHKNR